jgi:hypothetical protein
MKLIATANGNSGSTNIQFTNIPQTYQFLRVVGQSRTAEGGGGSNAWIGAVIYFNDEATTSNVVWRRMISYNTNNWITDTSAGPDLQANGTNTESGFHGVSTWWCTNYSDSNKYKSFGAYVSGTNTSNSFLNSTNCGQYRSNTPITSIRFDFSYGLDPASVYSLYGIEG